MGEMVVILAGLQKNSFIDYPGKISCVLFTTGCNFICPYCHNADLAKGAYPERIQQTQAIDFLKSRRGMLEGVTITGGEPSLDEGIFDLCRAIKSLGYPIKLDTNGSRPGVIRRLLNQHLIDFVAMDIKAPIQSYDPFCRQPHIETKLAASIRLIMAADTVYEFRTTCVSPFIDETAIETIAKTIQGAARYVLQTFNQRATCLDPVFNRRQDPTLFPERMQQLQTLAAPFVDQCTVR